MVDEIIKNKRSKKKDIKENNLFEAAYELFTSKGIPNTAIDDIVKKAGVAKGTFYLYFKDKYDIIDRIILRKSALVTMEAIKAVEGRDEYNEEDYMNNIIYFVDYIIEYFKEDKKLLKLIYKNLSWGIYRRALQEDSKYSELRERFNKIIEAIKTDNDDFNNIEKVMFMVIELTGSVCYSSIILEEPDTIDNMKPELFKMIRKMLAQ